MVLSCSQRYNETGRIAMDVADSGRLRAAGVLGLDGRPARQELDERHGLLRVPERGGQPGHDPSQGGHRHTATERLHLVTGERTQPHQELTEQRIDHVPARLTFRAAPSLRQVSEVAVARALLLRSMSAAARRTALSAMIGSYPRRRRKPTVRRWAISGGSPRRR